MNKQKDYKKLARIKSAVFLVLAVIVLAGMYLNEKPETKRDDREETGNQQIISAPELSVSEDGTYTDKEHVALYLHEYGKLPSNFITKTQAKKQGWDPDKGNLQEVLPGKSIGGGPFQNEEKMLPEKEGRNYYECDIDYAGGQRNEKRIVYSDDGLIYYTGDHYQTFECLYGEKP